MIKPGDSIARGLLILLLTTGQAHAYERPAGGDATGPAGASSMAGPIGAIKSLGVVVLNGRAAYGEQTVWSGDLIRAPEGGGARVVLDSVGQITLASGATVRLSTRLSKRGKGIDHYVLVASLASGDMDVKLGPRASAYIEARGSIVTAAGGASFRLGAGGKEARLNILGGEVHLGPQGQIPRRRRLGPVEVNLLTMEIKPGSKVVYMRPYQSRLISSQAKETKKKPEPISFSFVSDTDEPVEGLMIRFTLLGSPPIGRFDPVETATDKNGVASTTFTSTTDRGEARFTVEAVDSSAIGYNGKIVIGKKPGLFRLRNLLIGAAIIGTVVAVSYPRPKRPIEQIPPVIIIPEP